MLTTLPVLAAAAYACLISSENVNAATPSAPAAAIWITLLLEDFPFLLSALPVSAGISLENDGPKDWYCVEWYLLLDDENTGEEDGRCCAWHWRHDDHRQLLVDDERDENCNNARNEQSRGEGRGSVGFMAFQDRDTR